MTQAYLFAPSAVIGNLLRSALWLTFAGLVAAGACLGGGYGVYVAWVKAGPPARRRRRLGEAAVIREASRGITEIEAFLAARCAPRGPEPRPPAGGAA
jgi:hypothetical protein